MNGYCYVTDDKELLMKSSSGGAFGDIAKNFIKCGGFVYAVTIDYENNCNVKYIRCTSIEDLNIVYGSKYVKADINHDAIMNSIYQDLYSHKKVLFVGCPCQLVSVYTYLKVKNCNINNFYSIRLICHGTPQNKFYYMYKNYLEQKYKSSIININFRNKKYGWKNYIVSIEFKNGKRYEKNQSKDPYLFLFLENYTLNSSCYVCKSKTNKLLGDITIGDFWGIEKTTIAKYENSFGTSLIISSSLKGEQLISKLQKRLVCLSKDELEIVLSNYNKVIYSSVNKPLKYKNAMKISNKNSTNSFIKLYYYVKLINFINKIKKRMIK